MSNNPILRSQLSLVPLPIRSWFASEEVSSMVQEINKHFNLAGNSSSVIPILLLRLEAKDLQPDYFAGELAGELKIDRDKALLISEEINRSVLGPLKKDFSDIGIDISLLNKFQIPVMKDLKANASDEPKIIQDVVTKPAPKVISISAPKPTPVPINKATSQNIAGNPTMRTTAISNPNSTPMPASTVPKANRLSDIGWSQQRTAEPMVKLDVSQLQAAAPKAPATPVPQKPAAAPTKPTIPGVGPMSEFDRLNMMKRNPNAPAPSAPAAPVIPSPSAAPATPAAPTNTSKEPAPFMLHQDTSFSAATKNADFKIPQPPTSADMHLSSIKKPEQPVKAAVLEFGQSGRQSVPTPKPTSSSSVTHYTEFRPSLSNVPTQNSGPRQVNQIMPSVAKPAAQPTPAIPVPRPPLSKSAPAAPVPTPQQKEKVIVKDFL